MPRPLTLGRRAFVALLLTFGLALMHGGIGQATACNSMAAMANANMAPSMTTSGSVVASAAPEVEMVDHHQPGHDPATAHASGMCVAAPAGSSGGGSKAWTSAAAPASYNYLGQPQRPATTTRATGREPPAPDLVSVLNVNRR